MYHVNAQGVNERMISVHYYHYYPLHADPSAEIQTAQGDIAHAALPVCEPGGLHGPTVR